MDDLLCDVYGQRLVSKSRCAGKHNVSDAKQKSQQIVHVEELECMVKGHVGTAAHVSTTAYGWKKIPSVCFISLQYMSAGFLVANFREANSLEDI